LQAVIEHYIVFLDSIDAGDWKITKASQSFSIYRHKFMRQQIKIHNNAEVIELERKAYGGGMVRVYKTGLWTGEKFYKLDVNSMYPYVMYCYQYPHKLLSIRRDVTVSELKKLIDRTCVVADMTVKPKQAHFRRLAKNRVIYPLYQFRGVFTTAEVRELIKQEAIVEIHRVAVYLSGNLFSEFVDYFYTLRTHFKSNGNALESKFCKDVMNSLYGKFGARSGAMVKYEHQDELAPNQFLMLDSATGKVLIFYWIAGEAFVESDEEEGFDSFVAIAAHVTAYARIYLQQLIDVAEVENVFYSDTDSIITNSIGYKNLKEYIDQDRLGALKVEDTADCLEVNCRKDYRIGKIRRLKGASRLAEENVADTAIKEEWGTLIGYWGQKKGERFGIRLRKIKLNREVYDGEIQTDGTVTPYTSPPNFDPEPDKLW